MSRTISFILFCLTAFCVIVASCRHQTEDVQPGPGYVYDTDSVLYARSVASSGFYWYQQNDTVRASSTESPHSRFFRVRFNTIAQSALTDLGRLPGGASFPEGSLIVKELYDSTTAPVKYLAVMYKDAKSPYQSSGWVWLEIKGNGDRYISSSEKGVQCVSCHSSGRDYARIFDLF